MANTYYDSQLTAAEIEAALEAIDGVIVPANNGKVLAINNGKIEARSVQWGGGSAVLEPLSVTANGDYTPEAGVDGFDEVHVSVPNSYSASDEGKVVNNGALVAQTARASQITQNGTYDTTLNDEVTVNVSGSTAVVQPLSVTQNGTYNPPSGVDGYAPVTVSVSGGGSSSVETASVFRWTHHSATTCWGIMKKLSGGVIGQNGDNANADIPLVGDLMTVTLHGASQSVEVLATSAIKLRAYRTGRTLGPATMTEYTMSANDQQSFTQDNVYGGIYFEAEAV